MIKVSVIVTTYNQEKYIKKTLDSIISQKTNFDFEILVGDDCSKDGTGKIVEEYGKRFPDRIVPIIRPKNLGAFNNNKDLYERAKGEYIALLEGDDYWTDDEKLQKQVEFLDDHADYAAVFGKCIVVDENNNRNQQMEELIPFFTENDYTSKEFEQYLLPGQTATAMYRKTAFNQLLDKVKTNKRVMPRVPAIDRFLVLGILSVGKIYNTQEYVAAYRYILNKSSGSWSSKNDYYSLKNALFFLFGLNEMERVGKELRIHLDFDDRRWYEFRKAGQNKRNISIISVNLIRFFSMIWFNDKKKFFYLFRTRNN